MGAYPGYDWLSGIRARSGTKQRGLEKSGSFLQFSVIIVLYGLFPENVVYIGKK